MPRNAQCCTSRLTLHRRHVDERGREECGSEQRATEAWHSYARCWMAVGATAGVNLFRVDGGGKLGAPREALTGPPGADYE